MRKTLLLITLLLTLGWHTITNAQNPLLWGMTSGGGTDTIGTIFNIKGDGTGFQTLHSFDVATGNTPYGTLLLGHDNKFYGLTIQGGANNKGTIFSFDSANVYTDLHDFTGNAGNAPMGKLLQTSSGKMYGMTFYDDSIGAGVIFKYNPATNTYAKMATLSGVGNGQSPRGSLMQASNGKMYGLTTAGGAHNSGTIVTIDTLTNVITNVHNFDLPTGINPFADLIQASNGLLYGVTMYYGTTGDGIIFSFNPATNVFTDLFHFAMTNGAFPRGNLLQAPNGKLYGLTYGGGPTFNGVLFSYDITLNTLTDLVQFNGTNGSRPTGSLMQASNGNLYGMTSEGGANGFGNIFSYNISTNVITTIHDFNGTDGKRAFGSLIEAHTTSSLGISNYSAPETNTITIAPNPATSSFTISSGNRIQSIKVFNVIGEIVFHSEPNNIQSMINSSQFSKGIYFVQITDENKNVVNRKVLVQ